VRLDAAGIFTARHTQVGQARDYGPRALPAPEAAALWRLIAAADIAHLESSTRQPVPDEGAYTLRVRDARGEAVACIWRGDALKNSQIAALVAGLAAAIEEVTGVRPVLR
jgi:hypothetical protein